MGNDVFYSATDGEGQKTNGDQKWIHTDNAHRRYNRKSTQSVGALEDNVFVRIVAEYWHTGEAGKTAATIATTKRERHATQECHKDLQERTRFSITIR